MSLRGAWRDRVTHHASSLWLLRIRQDHPRTKRGTGGDRRAEATGTSTDCSPHTRDKRGIDGCSWEPFPLLSTRGEVNFRLSIGSVQPRRNLFDRWVLERSVWVIPPLQTSSLPPPVCVFYLYKLLCKWAPGSARFHRPGFRCSRRRTDTFISGCVSYSVLYYAQIERPLKSASWSTPLVNNLNKMKYN